MLHVLLKSLQDEANKSGGKWMVRLKKGISSRCWENLVGGELLYAYCSTYSVAPPIKRHSVQ